MNDDYKQWYDEAMLASNAAGYSGMTAAQTIEFMDAEWKAQHARITELQAQLQQYQWQPIETAPKDGTEILVLFKRIGVKCVSWTDRQGDSDGDYAIWSVDDNKYDPYPLRGYNEGDELGWMPRPAAPTIAEGKA